MSKSMSKPQKRDKRLKFQKYFNMGNIFTILDDIWDWMCLYAEEIVATVLCVSMMAILLGGMICLLLWSGNAGDGSGSNSGNVSVSSVSSISSSGSSSISSSISSNVENSIGNSVGNNVENSSAEVNVMSDKMD